MDCLIAGICEDGRRKTRSPGSVKTEEEDEISVGRDLDLESVFGIWHFGRDI
jgi:hypothetical protein